MSDFAAGLKGGSGRKLPSIVAGERGEGIPLSYAQQRLWFLALMGGVSEAYHMPMALRLEGELDRGALRGALDRIVKRHEALRTRFVVVEGEPEQRIAAEETASFQLEECELSRESDDDADEGLKRLIAEEGGAICTAPML
jgi:hypothetical protein